MIRPGQRGARTLEAGTGVAPNAERNRSRKASIRQTGASGPGSIPSSHPHDEVCSSTAGSEAMIVTGTSCEASGPVTTEAGWWSPTRIMTRSRSCAWRVATNEIRALYAESIEYSLSALISFVTTLHEQDDDLVLVLLGDHQPASVVTGPDASHDVPITIIAADPAVLEQTSSWGWDDGMLPGPDAPVWRMDAFRDRVLGAFGPVAGAASPVAEPR